MHCCSPSHFGFVLFTPPLPSPANTTHQQPSLAPNPTHQPKQGQEVHQAGMPQIPFSTPLPLSMSAPQLEAGSDMCACVQMPLEQQPFGGALVAVSQHEHDSCKLRHVVACPHAVDEQHRPPSTPLPPPPTMGWLFLLLDAALSARALMGCVCLPVSIWQQLLDV
jgi:hypothetical protein